MYNGFGGFRIIENASMVTRKQARTHKKKRINKKWAKRYGFINTPKKEVLKYGDIYIMHPAMVEAFRNSCRK